MHSLLNRFHTWQPPLKTKTRLFFFALPGRAGGSAGETYTQECRQQMYADGVS